MRNLLFTALIFVAGALPTITGYGLLRQNLSADNARLAAFGLLGVGVLWAISFWLMTFRPRGFNPIFAFWCGIGAAAVGLGIETLWGLPAASPVFIGLAVTLLFCHWNFSKAAAEQG